MTTPIDIPPALTRARHIALALLLVAVVITVGIIATLAWWWVTRVPTP